MSRRQKREEPEGGNERWLITYADLITLLMIFFVIMYAMSKVDVTKFNTLAESLSSALQHQPSNIPMGSGGGNKFMSALDPSTQNKESQSKNVTVPDQKLDKLYAELQAYIVKHGLQTNVQVVDEQRGVKITLKDVVLFDTGHATIKLGARSLLDGLVPFMQKLDNAIVIEGYADDRPINTPKYPSNWELSGTRALNVLKFFAGAGIASTRMSYVGYGKYHPVEPNTTEAGRQANRRVNIVIIRKVPIVVISPSLTNTTNQTG